MQCDDFSIHPLTSSVSPSPKTVLGLNDCFDSFVKEEILRQSEAWYCSKCKAHQCAYKKFDIWSLPDILVVHLKRFTPSRFGRFDKIDSFVNFPVHDLDMSEWIVNENDKQNAVYDLFAVSNHYGSLGGGHYTAYAKHLRDQKWFKLDDSDTIAIQNDAEVRTSAAYVLFYRRKKMKMTTETLIPKQ
jgi:ubiquitin carboxyl-terminal hydrolase 4/11/15